MVADTLSRAVSPDPAVLAAGTISAISAVPGISLQDMAKSQFDSREALRRSLDGSALTLELLPSAGVSLLCDTGSSPPRIVVPEPMVDHVISSVHSLACLLYTSDAADE